VCLCDWGRGMEYQKIEQVKEKMPVEFTKLCFAALSVFLPCKIFLLLSVKGKSQRWSK